MEVSAFYGGINPRELPLYSQGEVGDFIHVPRSTLRGWMGAFQDRYDYYGPLIESPEGHEGRLSFNNLIEVYVLNVFRKAEGVKMSSIRKAAWTARQKLDVDRPFLSDKLRVSGDIFWDDLGTLINLSKGGQLAIRKVLEAYLKRIEYDQATGLPLRLYPMVGESVGLDLSGGAHHIVIDPEIGFGQPTVEGRGVTTRVLAERVNAGESVEGVARSYGIPEDVVLEALVYEQF